MAPTSDHVDLELLQARFGVPVWLALYTAAPSKAGGGTEVSGFGYARLEVEPALWTFSGPPHQIANNAPLLFPPASGGAWGDVEAMGIHDAATGGNLLFYRALSDPPIVPVADGQRFAFPVSELVVRGTV